MHNLLVTNRP